MYCSKCGKEISDDAIVCMHCGCPTQNYRQSGQGKSWVVTLVLCIFFGGLGAHRFYTGHVGIGIAQLLTLGGCGIWALIDLILILFGSYKTPDGFDLQK